MEELLSKHRRLRFEPGSKAAYTNLGYLVLGEVISRVSGQPFEEYVRTNVLAPLRMTHTDFLASAGHQWATPYQRRFTPLSVVMPLLVPRTIIGSKQGRYISLNPFYVDGAAYGGLGWFRRGASPDADFVEHLGGGAGFWSCMRIYPDRDLRVVVMGNATTYDHQAIVQAAADAAG